MFGSGYDVVEMMGPRPELRRAHTTVAELSYVNPGERGEGDIAYSRVASVFNGRILSFMRGDLERSLVDAVNGVRYGTTIDEASNGTGVTVTLTDVLAEELRDGVGTGGSIVAYERRVRPFVQDRRRTGRSTARWFVPTRRWRIDTRRTALAAAYLPGATNVLRAVFSPLRDSVVWQRTPGTTRAV